MAQTDSHSTVRKAKTPRSVTSLSFVGDIKSREGNRRCFWHVKRTGDYSDDCRIGEKFAIEYLTFSAAEDRNITPDILPWIVRDFPRKTGGIEVGFLSVIGACAVAGRRT